MLRLHYACHCGIAWRREISSNAPSIGDLDRCPKGHGELRPVYYETVSLPQGASTVGLVLVCWLILGCAAALAGLVYRLPALAQWAGL